MQDAKNFTIDPPVSPTRFKDKVEDTLTRLRLLCYSHNSEYERLNYYDEIGNTVTALFLYITVSAIFVGGVFGNNWYVLLISSILSTIAGIISTVQTKWDVRGKYMKYWLSARQFSDLIREVNMRIDQNHMGTADWQALQTLMNNRLTVIEDYTLPVEVGLAEPRPSPAMRSATLTHQPSRVMLHTQPLSRETASGRSP
jgi:hypothetical protein